ncbi:MAG: hypothetical protein RBT71_02975 [Flavobacteriales bacterium]|jgi:hypothetical protein|nr:hypothetical protein [Flavobacteriales bacterium]
MVPSPGALLACALLLSHVLVAAPQSAHGFRSHTVHDPGLGRIDLHLVDDHLHDTLPLLVFLDGSGAHPIMSVEPGPDGAWLTYSTIPEGLRETAARHHIVLVSKPAVPLIDTVRSREATVPPAAYTEKLSADWRAQAASRAITEVLEHYPVDRGRIGVMGFSEGAQVAPRVAVIDPRITHVMAFAGGALNQFFHPIIELRMDAARGAITHQEAQARIDSLFAEYERIYADPQATDKSYWGHSYLRWSSFTDPPTLDAFVSLDIPVYLAQGSTDRNTQPLGADYVRLEFLRRRKTNLTFRAYPGCDHFFNCVEVDAAGEEVRTMRLAEVWAEALQWFNPPR